MIVDDNGERLLTPGEVAALFRVDPKTVTRWAASGRISSIRTPGGHRRFRESEVHALLRGTAELRRGDVTEPQLLAWARAFDQFESEVLRAR